MNKMSKTPISVISGYLGAGKTTLLRKIIEKLDRKFAIIMNEFGEVGIDTQMIQGKNLTIAELAGGCVCCSLTGEFEEAVKEIIEKYHPEIIIVETTGVAEPDALILDITDSMPEVKLDSVIVVADADALARFPTIGRTGAVQIEMADIVILNKIDLVTEAQRVDVKVKIRQYNKKAPIVETKHAEVDIDLLFNIEADHIIKKVHPEHKSTFQSFTYTFKNQVNREGFEALLLQLPPQIYRLKGFVKFEEDDTYLVNYVAGRWELERMPSESLDIVFIGETADAVKYRIISMLDRLQNGE